MFQNHMWWHVNTCDYMCDHMWLHVITCEHVWLHLWSHVITCVITCDFGTCSCGIFVREGSTFSSIILKTLSAVAWPRIEPMSPISKICVVTTTSDCASSRVGRYIDTSVLPRHFHSRLSFAGTNLCCVYTLQLIGPISYLGAC